MGVIKTKVGNAEVLVETFSVNTQDNFPGMTDTSSSNGISDKLLDVFQSAKDVIDGIVEEFSDIATNSINPPDETKIGFSMSLSTEGNLWVVKGSGNVTLNVELTWKGCERDV